LPVSGCLDLSPEHRGISTTDSILAAVCPNTLKDFDGEQHHLALVGWSHLRATSTEKNTIAVSSTPLSTTPYSLPGEKAYCFSVTIAGLLALRFLLYKVNPWA
jgi:hypothetical protein